jgi:hypothetical protein
MQNARVSFKSEREQVSVPRLPRGFNYVGICIFGYVKEISYGEWYRLKRRGEDRYQWIWKFKRPFRESDLLTSRATIERGVMEVYYHFKTQDRIDTRATAKVMGRSLAKLFRVPKYITSVDCKAGMVTAAFYCRCSEDDRPSNEVMGRAPEIIESSKVEAEQESIDYSD